MKIELTEARVQVCSKTFVIKLYTYIYYILSKQKITKLFRNFVIHTQIFFFYLCIFKLQKFKENTFINSVILRFSVVWFQIPKEFPCFFF